MKKYLFGFQIIVLLTVFNGTSLSQLGKETVVTTTTNKEVDDEVTIHNMIALNPIEFLIFFNLAYYREITPGFALGVGAHIPSTKLIGGYGVTLEGRLYPFGKALRRFYVAPNVSYNKLSEDKSGISVTASSIGLLLGWQWFVGDAFAIGLGAGFDYYFGTASDNTDFASYSGTLPALRFDIGFGW